MLVIDNKFELGQLVYLITDLEQEAYHVVEIHIRPGGSILYSLCIRTSVSDHYEFEISLEKDETKKYG